MTNQLRLLAYCGLYCPKCCYHMKIALSAKKLFNELILAQEKGSTLLLDDPSIKKVINKLINLECTKFCREGAKQSENCSIKICCNEHKIMGCWECPDFNSCKKLKKEFFDNNCKIRELGIEKYIKMYE